jgi:hypothetical protein
MLEDGGDELWALRRRMKRLSWVWGGEDYELSRHRVVVLLCELCFYLWAVEH